MSMFWPDLWHAPVTSWQGCGWFRPDQLRGQSKRFLFETNSRRAGTHRGNDHMDPAVLAACQAAVYESKSAEQRAGESSCPALLSLGKIVHRGFFRPVSKELSTAITERFPAGTSALHNSLGEKNDTPGEVLRHWAAARRAFLASAPVIRFDDEPDGARTERRFWSYIQQSFHDGALAPWIHPQPLFRNLLGHHAKPNEQRRADFLICPPWTEPLIVEIHGVMDPRDIEKDRDLKRAQWRTFNCMAGQTTNKAVDSALTELLPPPNLDLHPESCRVIDAFWVAAQVEQALHWALYRGLWSSRTPLIDVQVPEDLKWVAEASIQTFVELATAVSTVWSREILTPAMRASAGISDAENGSVTINIDPDRPTYLGTDEDDSGADLIIRRLSLPWVQPQPPCLSIRPEARLARPASATSPEALEVLVKHVFCHDQVLPGQLEAIDRALKGPSCLVIMPAGSGKSLVFQLSALLLPGSTFVVEAWRALIDDQVRHLYELGLGRCVGIHRDRRLKEPLRDALIVYLAPERLFVKGFGSEQGELLRSQGLSLIVIDEAHAASEAGHSFRPSYLGLVERIQKQLQSAGLPPAPVLALTATAADIVIHDVRALLGIKAEPMLLVGLGTTESGNPSEFIRSNMELDFVDCPSMSGHLPIEKALKEFVGQSTTTLGKGIVFCSSRGKWSTSHRPHWYGAKGTYERLLDLFPATDDFQSPIAIVVGGDGEASENAHSESQRFISGEALVMVATPAFGTGVDVSGVRWVCHIGFPAGLEAYYQEICRAGRDGKGARCQMIFDADSPQLLDALVNCQEADDPIDALRKPIRSLQRNKLGSIARRLQLLIGSNTQPPTKGDVDPTKNDDDSLYAPPFPGWRLESEMIDAYVIQKLSEAEWCRETSVDFPERLDGLMWRSIIRMRLLGIIDPGYQRTFSQRGRNHFYIEPTGIESLAVGALAKRVEELVQIQRGREAAKQERERLEPTLLDAETPSQRLLLAAQSVLRSTYKTVFRMRLGSLVELHRLIQEPTQEQRRQLINDYFTEDQFSRQIKKWAVETGTIDTWTKALALAHDQPAWRTGTFLNMQSALPGAALPSFLLSLYSSGNRRDSLTIEYSLHRWLVDAQLPEDLLTWALPQWMTRQEGDQRKKALGHLERLLASARGENHTRLSRLICNSISNEDHAHPVASSAIHGWLKPILEYSH